MWSASAMLLAFARTGEPERDEAPGTAIAVTARAAAATKIARCTALSVASHIGLAISRGLGVSHNGFPQARERSFENGRSEWFS